jgi:hypothetical protein
MPKKIIFTPFEVRDQGTLSTALNYVGDKQKGGYRGFKDTDRVSPSLNPGGTGENIYAKTELLRLLINPDDQLYINGHCSKGSDHLATNENTSKGKHITAPEIVQQLTANGLSKETKAKIKLWACESAAGGSNGEDPFVVHLAKALYKAGYRSARLFAYTESVRQSYIGTGEEAHKYGAIKPASNDEKIVHTFLWSFLGGKDQPGAKAAQSIINMIKKAVPGFVEKSWDKYTAKELADIVRGCPTLISAMDRMVKGFESPGAAAGYVTGERASHYRKEITIEEIPKWVHHGDALTQ